MHHNMQSVPFKQGIVCNTMNDDYSKYRPDYELPKVTYLSNNRHIFTVYFKYFGENWTCFNAITLRLAIACSARVKLLKFCWLISISPLGKFFILQKYFKF